MKRHAPMVEATPTSSGRRRFLQTSAALAGGLLLEIGGAGIRTARAVQKLWGMVATGGSTSVSWQWEPLRRAGATARAILVAEAARRWSVDPATCRTSNSEVIHAASGRRLNYGELATGAAAQPVPQQVTLKRPDQFVLIGKPRRSYRVVEKLTGRAQYAIDVNLPGMLIAIVVHPDVVNAKVKSFNDDIRGLYYQSASVHKARAALDASGRVTGLSLRAVVPSIKEPDDPGFLQKFPVDPSCTESMHADFHYDIGTLDLAWVRHEPGFPIWWWRAVIFVPNVFAIESITDEAAHAARQDPIAYRSAMLTSRPELHAVLQRAATLDHWMPHGTRDADGTRRGMGVAIYNGYQSFIAIIAEVAVKDHTIAVRKVTCVVDCGIAVDPGSVHQQLAGGIHWGVSTALMNVVHIEHGQVRESNFHDYPVLRIHEAPVVQIELMPPTDRKPGGIGELSNPPVVPAIGNAIFAATGQRLRTTPFALA